MRVEAVKHEQERLPLPRPLEKLHPAGEEPRGEVVLFGPASARVGQVLAHLVHHVLVVAGDYVLFHQILREAHRGAVAVPLLAPDPVEHPKAPLEVHGGMEEGLGIRVQDGAVAGGEQDLRERDLFLGDRLPARRLEGLPRKLDPFPERPGPHAGVNGPAGADSGQRLGVGPRKAQALPGQGVQVGGLDRLVAVGAYVIFSQAVQNHHYSVHF